MSAEGFSKEEIVRIAAFFRLGYYRTDQEGKFLECDAHAREVFEIPQEGINLSHFSIADLYEIPLERNLRLKTLQKEPLRPFSDAITIKIGEKKRILFDISWLDEGGNISGLVREMEESSLLRYVRQMERMPTGFFHLKYEDGDQSNRRERLTHCNEVYAKILGFENKQSAIGNNMIELFRTSHETRNIYLKDLEEADKQNKPLKNYQLTTKKYGSNTTLYLSIDAHLIKDAKGRVIGREGTIRDVSELKKLEDERDIARENYRRTTEDTDKFIHRFLHPVVKFAGQSELLFNLSNLLKDSVKSDAPSISDDEEKGKKLIEYLNALIATFPDDKSITDKIEDDKVNYLNLSKFRDQLDIMINIFYYSLNTLKSNKLLTDSVRETALWVLDELKKAGFPMNPVLNSFIKEEFINFIHGILFDYLVAGTNILKSESEIMRHNVEALRDHIVGRKKRILSIVTHDIGAILVENVERFKPIFKEKGIDIDYRSTGNLNVRISPPDIDRVICNLMHNAYKYSYPGKRRTLKVSARELQPDNVVEFAISNYGTPIKKNEIVRIFNFGYRGELAYKADRDGTGIGLADSKEIIEDHGGIIEITSRPSMSKDYSELPQYNVPYITTVTVRIPKPRKNRG